MQFRISIFSISLVLATIVGTPHVAHAYEDRYSLDVGLSAGVFLGTTKTGRAGPDLTLGMGFGLNDMWSARFFGAYAYHPDSVLPTHVIRAGAELIYSLDIVQVVPFVGLGLGGFISVQDGHTEANPAFHVVVGFDYLVNRQWVVGLDIRPTWLPLSLDSSVQPTYLAATLRISLMFDRF